MPVWFDVLAGDTPLGRMVEVADPHGARLPRRPPSAADSAQNPPAYGAAGQARQGRSPHGERSLLSPAERNQPLG